MIRNIASIWRRGTEPGSQRRWSAWGVPARTGGRGTEGPPHFSLCESCTHFDVTE